MALLTFELTHGITAVSSDDKPITYHEVGLRELTAADLIDAQLESEKVVVNAGKAVAYTSDVLYGLNLLCRQVEYIGDIKGPLTIKMLKKLHIDDLDLLRVKTEELDRALTDAIAARGRSDSAG